MWGFDLIIHPQVGEFDFPLDQIPTISPPSPYWGGGVGFNIDRCIIAIIVADCSIRVSQSLTKNLNLE